MDRQPEAGVEALVEMILEGRTGSDASRSAFDYGKRVPSRFDLSLEGLEWTFSLLGRQVRSAEHAILAISDLAVELMYEAFGGLETPPYMGNERRPARVLNVPARIGARPPALLILDPGRQSIADSVRATSGFAFGYREAVRVIEQLNRPSDSITRGGQRGLFSALLGATPEALVELVNRAAPEILISRAPRMIPLCAPSTSVLVSALQVSSAGVFCRDETGQFGVTACYHGTGPVGAKVMVGTTASRIARADPVQDIVFIPLPDVFPHPTLRGRGGVLHQRHPAQADPAEFIGATSGHTRTRISSHDAGLLRQRPTMQLKVQTTPDTNQGDSGCALIDEDDRVIGFAFERTAFDDFPQISDWIWADNALRALKLTPI